MEDAENKIGEAQRKLTASAMLALSPAAEEALARDFAGLKEGLDAVVRSEAAAGPSPAGPLHTEKHRVLRPEDAAASARENGDGRGRQLLEGAARFDGTYAVVPRVV